MGAGASVETDVSGTGLDSDVTRLLAVGPFEDALRAAIRARGLGLERLRSRLAAAGVQVSLATLSYWQSGRRRPGRRDSLAALGILESELRLPCGSLGALLGPPKPRGRAGSKASIVPDIAEFWPRRGPVRQATAEVNTTWDDRLTRLSLHDIASIGPTRTQVSHRSRQVLRAESTGPDRCVVIVHIDDHTCPTPLVKPLRRCSVGRIVNRQADGLVVAELLFDRPLIRGETILIEHEWVSGTPGGLTTNSERKFRLPVREYVLEVCFDEAAKPARVEQFTTLRGQPPAVREARIDEQGLLHGVALDFGPGCYGFRWDWDD